MYSGRVYDGPWEGRMHSCDRPWFVVQINPFSLASHFDRWKPDEIVTVRQGYYRWSSPLRAWVFCWDDRYSRYAYEDARRYG